MTIDIVAARSINLYCPFNLLFSARLISHAPSGMAPAFTKLMPKRGHLLAERTVELQLKFGTRQLSGRYGYGFNNSLIHNGVGQMGPAGMLW